jgi:hypothetical protein
VKPLVYTEDGGSKFVRIVGIHLPHYTTSQSIVKLIFTAVKIQNLTDPALVSQEGLLDGDRVFHL